MLCRRRGDAGLLRRYAAARRWDVDSVKSPLPVRFAELAHVPLHAVVPKFLTRVESLTLAKVEALLGWAAEAPKPRARDPQLPRRWRWSSRTRRRGRSARRWSVRCRFTRSRKPRECVRGGAAPGVTGSAWSGRSPGIGSALDNFAASDVGRHAPVGTLITLASGARSAERPGAAATVECTDEGGSTCTTPSTRRDRDTLRNGRRSARARPAPRSTRR